MNNDIMVNGGQMVRLLKRFKHQNIGVINFMLVMIFFTLSPDAHSAAQCVSGCGSVTTTITDTLSSNDNAVGHTKASSPVSISAMQIRMTTAAKAMQWIAYAGDSVSAPGYYQGDWVYRNVDDYIQVALRRYSECAFSGGGYIYVPFNINVWNGSGNNCSQRVYSAGEVASLNALDLQSQIKLRRKIVSGTYSKSILIARAGYCQPDDCSSAQVSRNIYLNLNITATQSCTLNAGQVINIDFGNISSGAFTTAGARPEGVNDIVRNISIECDGIAANTAMTVRLQADNVSGKAVVTNTNNDVGFVVADGNGTALTPNNLSSIIPFTLDSYGNSNVTIRVYPVSVTGNKPAEGPVTSQAYLRVDFA